MAVTGAGGKLGRILLDDLLSHGYEVVAIDRVASDRVHARLEHRTLDLVDAADADAALAGCRALIHLAAITDPVSQPAPLMFATNVQGTFNLLDAAARRGLERVLLASSQSVLGHPWASQLLPLDYVPVDEDHPARPVDPYALSKLLGEQMGSYAARTHGLRVLSLRFPSVWLPEHFPWRPNVRLTELEQAAKSMWAYVDVRDAARACRLALAATWEGHEVVNITSRWAIGAAPVRELLAAWYPGTTDMRTELDDCTAIFDWHRAERLLGFRARFRWLPDGIHDVSEEASS